LLALLVTEGDQMIMYAIDHVAVIVAQIQGSVRIDEERRRQHVCCCSAVRLLYLQGVVLYAAGGPDEVAEI